MATHTITRRELYDLVWSVPITKLAARYGMSGRGLAKACERADIPVPERGYWTKVQAGQEIKKPLLLALKPGGTDRVTLHPRPAAPPPPPPLPPAIQEKIDAELRPERHVGVPATLANPHRIVAGWIQANRRKWEAHQHDAWFKRTYQPIDSGDLAKRRLRILSAFFKALEARGYKLVVEERYQRQVQIEHEREKFDITLQERIRHVRRRLTEKEKVERGYLSSGPKWKQERHATGQLVLSIVHVRRYSNKQWADKPEAPLETKLNAVLGEFAGLLEELRDQRAREAEERAERMKIEEEERRIEREHKRDTIRLHRLLRHCDEAERAAQIRAFVDLVDKSPRAADPTFAEWKSWALGHADRIDPLKADDLFEREVSDYQVYGLRE